MLINDDHAAVVRIHWIVQSVPDVVDRVDQRSADDLTDGLDEVVRQSIAETDRLISAEVLADRSI